MNFSIDRLPDTLFRKWEKTGDYGDAAFLFCVDSKNINLFRTIAFIEDGRHIRRYPARLHKSDFASAKISTNALSGAHDRSCCPHLKKEKRPILRAAIIHQIDDKIQQLSLLSQMSCGELMDSCHFTMQ